MADRLWTLALVMVMAAACAPSERPDADAERMDELEHPRREHTPQVVDSVLPIPEELARFRSSLDEEPTALRGGAASLEALVTRFVAALAARDSLALREMLLSRSEFALLYYPHTRFTAKPYELSPQLLWFQMQNGTGRGAARALRRFGGTPVQLAGYQCEPLPDVEGPNLLWRGCVVRIAPAVGDTITTRLFGSILEREGHFKFVSYSNSL